MGTPPSRWISNPRKIDADVGEQFDGEVGAIEDVTDVAYRSAQASVRSDGAVAYAA